MTGRRHAALIVLLGTSLLAPSAAAQSDAADTRSDAPHPLREAPSNPTPPDAAPPQAAPSPAAEATPKPAPDEEAPTPSDEAALADEAAVNAALIEQAAADDPLGEQAALDDALIEEAAREQAALEEAAAAEAALDQAVRKDAERTAAQRAADQPSPHRLQRPADDAGAVPYGGLAGAAVAQIAVLALVVGTSLVVGTAAFLLTASFCPAWQIFGALAPAFIVATGVSGPVVGGLVGPAATMAGAYIGASDATTTTRTQLAAAALPGCGLGVLAGCGALTGGGLVATALVIGGPFGATSALAFYALALGVVLGGSSWAATFFAPLVALAGVGAQVAHIAVAPTLEAALAPEPTDDDAQRY